MYEDFLALRQSRSVREYRRRFEQMASTLEDISEQVLESTFINGLRSDIRAELKVLGLNGLEKAMGLAMKIEANNLESKSYTHGPRHSNYLPTRTQMGRGTTTLETTIPTKAHKGGGFKKLTEAELQSNQECGLCYKCDENFSPGDRCRKQELQVVLLQEYEAEAQVVEDVGQERELESKPMEGAENQVVEVSLNSVVGLTSPKTLKLAGEINNQKVVVLIDSGASHNFISNEVVSVLKLPITNTEH